MKIFLHHFTLVEDASFLSIRKETLALQENSSIYVNVELHIINFTLKTIN